MQRDTQWMAASASLGGPGWISQHGYAVLCTTGPIRSLSRDHYLHVILLTQILSECRTRAWFVLLSRPDLDLDFSHLTQSIFSSSP